jgi:hypothetical protein
VNPLSSNRSEEQAEAGCWTSGCGGEQEINVAVRRATQLRILRR